MTTRKAKLDTIESAVTERKLSREIWDGKKLAMATAKKQYDQTVTDEAVAAERAAKADRVLEKALDDAHDSKAK